MRYSTVKVLIKNGTDVNSREEGGSTGLMRAVANGQYQIAELLIENGSDITPVSNQGGSALRWAKRFKYVNLIALIERNLHEEIIITRNGNIRKGPGAQFEIVGKVTDDNEFMVVNQTEEWYKIKLIN
jgi:ankyrin repeat protein